MKSRTYLLGAGASKPAGIPLVNDFLFEGIFHLQRDSVSFHNISQYSKLGEYLKDRFNYDMEIDDPHKLEEKAGNIEKLLSEIHEESRKGKSEFDHVKREVERFIYLTIENARADNHRGNCYPEFVKKLNIGTKEEVNIITFNYENLFETACLHEGLSDKFSYLIDFDKDKINHYNRYEKGYSGHFHILKLHGSMNWSFCNKCNKYYLCWSSLYDNIFKQKCIDCKGGLDAILVPPVDDKHIPEQLKDIWKVAEDKIMNCGEITVIGYSFNDFDAHANNTILGALGKNKNNPRLNIVDLNPYAIFYKIYGNESFENRPQLDQLKNVFLFKGFDEYLKNEYCHCCPNVVGNSGDHNT